jgi:hypothetical protein
MGPLKSKLSARPTKKPVLEHCLKPQRILSGLSRVSLRERGRILIKRESFWVKPDPFIHLQRRDPLRDVPVDGKGQVEDVYGRKADTIQVRCAIPPYMVFARAAICVRSVCVS